MKIIYLFCFLTALLLMYKANAQNDCKQALIDANKQFESGKINESVATIEGCGLNSLTKDERFEAHRLLAIAYQALNNEAAMDKNIRAMLKLRPNYKRFPNIDPLEFTQVLKKYSVRQLLFVGLDLGLNSTGVSMVKSYSVFSSSQRYLPQKSFQLGLFADYRVTSGISLKANISVLGLGINHFIDSANGWSQDYTEQQRFVSLAISGFKYFKIYKDLKFCIGVGAGFNSLYKSQVNLVTQNLQDGSLRLATRNALEERNKFLVTLLPSAGLNYSVGSGYLGLNVTYHAFFKNTVVAGKRLRDENFIFNNQYINDDIRLKMLSFNLCYTRTLKYKTSKTKVATGHAVF